MIFFKLVVDNPWFKPSKYFESRDYFYRDGSFTKNKHWELQISRWETCRLADLDLDLRWRGHDHAGPSFEIELFGYMFAAKIYDARHWNHEEGRWYTDEDYPE